MKTEREIAELIFDQFRQSNSKAGHIIMERAVQFGIVSKINPKEQELCYIVLNGLIHTGYIAFKDDSPRCFSLTEKGYDYIYDDEKVALMLQKPWVIPTVEKTDWNKAFNHLWEVINKDGSLYYLSQTPFYNHVLKINTSLLPTLKRYLEEREKKGKSRTRKDFYFDLLDDLTVDQRLQFYVSIQLFIEETNPETEPKDDYDSVSVWDEPVPKPKEVVDSEKVQVIKIEKPTDMSFVDEQPQVFISYSWDDPEHEKWVIALAEKLCENGVNAILDKWDLGPLGKPLPNFMEQSIAKSKRVICIMTPNYKLKTDKSLGGVGYEYSIISSEIFTNGVNTSKFIPLIRKGSDKDAIPTILIARKYVDMRDDACYESKFVDELLRDIHNEPKYKKPVIGPKPKFN